MYSKNRIFIISALFGIIIIALMIVVYFLLTDIKSIGQDIIVEKEKKMLSGKQQQAIEEFKKSQEVSSGSLEMLDDFFVDSAKPIDFIEYLEASARSLGVTITINLASSPRGSDANKSITTLQLLVRGNFLRILELVEKLENGPYLVSVETFSTHSVFLGSDANSFQGVDSSITISVISK